MSNNRMHLEFDTLMDFLKKLVNLKKGIKKSVKWHYSFKKYKKIQINFSSVIFSY